MSRHLKGSFPTAQSFCKSFGMNLAALTTKDEYKHFTNYIIKNNAIELNMELIFVGGTRIGTKNWYWLPSGADLDYKLDWSAGEPNNAYTELCLSFYSNGGKVFWNDMTCETPAIRFLCEKI